MHREDPPGILVDPGNRVGARLETGADVELKHDILVSISRDHFDGTPVFDRFELRLVIVIARAKPQRLELLCSPVQGVGDRFPAVEVLDLPALAITMYLLPMVWL